MTKKLQKRFVITAMAAITLLLIVLLGIINIANTWYSSHETDKLLNILATGEAMPHRRLPDNERERRFFSPPPPEDTRMAAVYFSARDNSGEYELDLNRISSLSRAEALELVKQAANENSESGKIGNFKYQISISPINGRKAFVFLDTSSHRYAVLRVAALSVLAGFAVWALMLLVVILLSRQAILPIARNIEKQKQFVTDAGHEIKTPLAIILANTEAMELRNGENKWSRNIKAQVSRLDGLMKDLLTLARSDEAHIDLPKEDVNMSLLLSDCTDMFIESAALRGVSFEPDIPENITLTSHKEYLIRIISTLLDNAVKYAKPESTVAIHLAQHEKTTELCIRNTCEALPACDPEKLFDRFYREDTARTQKNGGYGIGLSAARAMISLLGGSIGAKYEGTDSIVFIAKL